MANLKFINPYTLIPDDGMRCNYPNYEKVKIELPFRAIICASAGAGKTVFLYNLIETMNCFHRLYIFCAHPNEPIYKLITLKMKEVMKARKDDTLFQIHDSLDKFPEVKSNKCAFDKNYHNLIVVDDLMEEEGTPMKYVKNAWIHGRKRNISCVFIAQNFYRIHPTIRKNTNLIILKKVATRKDLYNILHEYEGLNSLGFDGMLKAYYKATEQFETALVLDIAINTPPRWRVRINWDPVLGEGEE
jgi:hypothetical protein